MKKTWVKKKIGRINLKNDYGLIKAGLRPPIIKNIIKIPKTYKEILSLKEAKKQYKNNKNGGVGKIFIKASC